MASQRALGVVVLALCPLFLASATNPKPVDLRHSHGDPIVLTYEEAKALGLHTPPLTGMRLCTDADFHGGFETAEEAERSLRAYEQKWGESGSPLDCQVDPRDAVYVIGPFQRGLRKLGLR